MKLKQFKQQSNESQTHRNISRKQRNPLLRNPAEGLLHKQNQITENLADIRSIFKLLLRNRTENAKKNKKEN